MSHKRRSTGYELIGMGVWKGAILYLQRRFGHPVPSRKTKLLRAGAVLGAVVGVVGVVAALVLKSRDHVDADN